MSEIRRFETGSSPRVLPERGIISGRLTSIILKPFCQKSDNE